MAWSAKHFRLVLVSVIVSLIIAAVLAEIGLGIMENRAKQSRLDYADTKRPQGLGWGGFLIENLAIQVTDGLGGQVRWINNAAGFRSEREFSPKPAPGVLRILSLGDSFTAGFRVGQDETFSARQEEWINRELGPAEILVAEIEDPSIALYYLHRFGLQLQPQIVILGITLGNDIIQTYQGLDPHGRYLITNQNGKVHIAVNQSYLIGFEQLAAYKIPPEYLKAETPYERFRRRAQRWLKKRRLLRRFYQEQEAITSWGNRDHLSLFDLNNGFGVFTAPLPPEIEEAYQRLFRVLDAFSLTCSSHGIIFAVQLFPQRYQVQPGDWVQAVEEYGLNASRFDLMAPNRKIAAFCGPRGIICIDPTAAMAARYAETGRPLYLPRGDMHWNQEGQRAFFACSLPSFADLVHKGFGAVRARTPEGVLRGQALPGAIDPKPKSMTSGAAGN